MSLLITRGLGPEGELGSFPVIVSVACIDSRIVRITFLEPVRLETQAETPLAWSIESVGHSMSVTVVGVSYSENVINLTTTDHEDGLRYRLNVPFLGIFDADAGGRYPGPFQFEYTGASLPPFIVIVKGVDQTAIDVVFSEEVVTQEALDPENYTVIGPNDVKVLSVEKLNEISYRLRTTPQARITGYTVAVTNIHDLSGNAIVSDHP